MITIHDIPIEIVALIFHFGNQLSLIMLGRTCSTWRALVASISREHGATEVHTSRKARLLLAAQYDEPELMDIVKLSPNFSTRLLECAGEHGSIKVVRKLCTHIGVNREHIIDVFLEKFTLECVDILLENGYKVGNLRLTNLKNVNMLPILHKHLDYAAITLIPFLSEILKKGNAGTIAWAVKLLDFPELIQGIEAINADDYDAFVKILCAAECRHRGMLTAHTYILAGYTRVVEWGIKKGIPGETITWCDAAICGSIELIKLCSFGVTGELNMWNDCNYTLMMALEYEHYEFAQWYIGIVPVATINERHMVHIVKDLSTVQTLLNRSLYDKQIRELCNTIHTWGSSETLKWFLDEYYYRESWYTIRLPVSNPANLEIVLNHPKPEFRGIDVGEVCPKILKTRSLGVFKALIRRMDHMKMSFVKLMIDMRLNKFVRYLCKTKFAWLLNVETYEYALKKGRNGIAEIIAGQIRKAGPQGPQGPIELPVQDNFLGSTGPAGQ
jgi:hypothetical protein